MSSIHLHILGIIHDCRWIDIVSFEIKKAGPFLTLPEYTSVQKIIND
jgi:hypothetical protein